MYSNWYDYMYDEWFIDLNIHIFLMISNHIHLHFCLLCFVWRISCGCAVKSHSISRRLPHFPEVFGREAETGKETEKERDWGNGKEIKEARPKKMRRRRGWWMRRATERKVTTRRTTDATPSHHVTCPEEEQITVFSHFHNSSSVFQHPPCWMKAAVWLFGKDFEYLRVLCVCLAFRNWTQGRVHWQVCFLASAL